MAYSFAGRPTGVGPKAIHEARKLLPPEGRRALHLALMTGFMELERTEHSRGPSQVGLAIFHDAVLEEVRQQIEGKQR